MQYDAFRSWLASRGIKADAINTRSYSVRKVDTSLAALGLPYSSLDDAWKAGEANAIDQRLKDLLSDIDNGDETDPAP